MLARPDIVLEVPTPLAFVPLLEPRRFKGARGGRGGGKSHLFSGLLIEECYRGHTRAACLREVQNSIKDSVKQLLEDKIRTYGLSSVFKVTEREIVCPRTDSLIIFKGLQNHTATSAKSMEGFSRAWYEEAQSLSKKSLEIAIPTFRKAGSEQWFSWNPDKEDDPVDTMFRKNEGDPDFVCVEVNYPDNPWFTDELRRDMERDRLRDPDKYEHIWMGGYRRNSEAQVFHKWRVERFETPANVQFYFGADWGFSVDPTVLVRCYIVGRTLYVDREAWQIGCETDRLGALFDRIPGARKNIITADSARPETISYMQRTGFPRMRPSIKGAGSVEDGIENLKGYDIVVHPDCEHVRRELTLFSYKTHPKTGDVTTDLRDDKNHTIDALRYALETLRRAPTSSSQPLII